MRVDDQRVVHVDPEARAVRVSGLGKAEHAEVNAREALAARDELFEQAAAALFQPQPFEDLRRTNKSNSADWIQMKQIGIVLDWLNNMDRTGQDWINPQPRPEMWEGATLEGCSVPEVGSASSSSVSSLP